MGIKSYIVKDKKEKDSELYEKNEWIDKYTGELKDKKNKENNTIYEDPDGKSFKFYEDLADFLNEREEAFSEHCLKEKYEYTVENSPCYCISVKNKSDGFLFYLKADQFGFSAPCCDKPEHPYDTYLRLKENSEDARIKVATWIYESRSIGGAFLWPMERNKDGTWNKNPLYNTKRGGSNKGGTYVEDRVDLTLWEIKRAYKSYEQYKQYDNEDYWSILSGRCTQGSNMAQWLDHFGNFETYVKYFCFDKDFCDENMMIYDIIPPDFEREKGKNLLDENRKQKKEIYGKPPIENADKIEKMLKNVNTLICKRSNIIEKEIKHYREK